MCVCVCARRYTFVEDVQNPQSVTILLKGQSDHVIAQVRACPVLVF